MEIKINGILDKIVLYENEKNKIVLEEIVNIKINEYTRNIIEDISEIAKEINYKIVKSTSNKIIIENNADEIIIIEFNMIEQKVYSKCCPYTQISFKFDEMTADLLLLIDDTYTYLEKINYMYIRWKIEYIGKSRKEYLIRKDYINIYADTIHLIYKIDKENEKSIEKILENIICKETNYSRVFRYYKRKKIALMEMKEQENIHSKLNINKTKYTSKYTYNGINFIYTDSIMSYNKYILKPEVKKRND